MIPSEVLRDTSEMGPQNTSPLGVASLRFSSIVVQIQIERLGSSNSRSPAPDAPFVQIPPALILFTGLLCPWEAPLRYALAPKHCAKLRESVSRGPRSSCITRD